MPFNPMDILRTIGRAGGRGMTRRDVLGSAAEQMMPSIDGIEEILRQSQNASDVFKAFPDLWDPQWGPLEEAEPEDIVHALQMVMEGLKGDGM